MTCERHSINKYTGQCDLCGEIVKPVDTSPEALTSERKSTHGDWSEQSAMGNLLKKDMRGSPHWNGLNAMQQEALDMIATKMSRILTGNPNEPDHWDDIAGYAFLGKGGHKK